MGKKRGRLPKVKKKRGRPKKVEQVEEEEEFESSSSDGDSTIQQTGPYGSASSPGSASAPLDTLTASRCHTRYAKALADKEAALNTSSRFPLQNDDCNPSENSTLLLVKQILIDASRLDPASNVPVEAFPSGTPVQAQGIHSQHENICPDKIIGALDGENFSSKIENRLVPSKKMLDLKKFTSDLLAQTQGPELPFQATPPCSEEIMVNNNLPEREANVVSNIFAHIPEDTANRNAQTCEFPTRSSVHDVPTVALMDNKSSENNEVIFQHENSFVDIDGYKVKKEVVPLLKAIFTKYGDIAKDSTFSMESRSCLLELVCSIYKRLEASKFMLLTPLELQSMLGQVGDLELVKVEVGWLHKRLNQISKVRQLCEGVSTPEDAESRIILVINEKQKAVETCEKELETCMAAVKKLQQRLLQEKDELAAALTVVDQIKNFCDGSLVHGLI